MMQRKLDFVIAAQAVGAVGAGAVAGWNGGRSVREGRAQGLAFARYRNRAAYFAVVCELNAVAAP